ncbi:MAG: methylglutaconyl-CoA hydratase [Halioglobus sp.]|jgi:methylglutaconyl-CoA hydratase
MSTVNCSVDGCGVATITLNNPDNHNAFDDAIIAQLTTAFQSTASDESVRVVILASEGKNFSAGADLNWMKRISSYGREENLREATALAQMLKILNFMPKPTIARVQGVALGGAVGLISCCDMSIASANASFSLSEVKIGLVPATISPYVISAIGSRAARRYFITAERFNANTALRLGLISEIAQKDDLDNTINHFVEQLLRNSPAAIKATKSLVFDVADRGISEALIEDTCQLIASIRASAEGQEGLAAFMEKRDPTWIKS